MDQRLSELKQIYTNFCRSTMPLLGRTILSLPGSRKHGLDDLCVPLSSMKKKCKGKELSSRRRKHAEGFLKRLFSRTSQIIGRGATLSDMTNFKIFGLYEAEDETSAPSSRATLCAKFIMVCKMALWLKEIFPVEEPYRLLAHDCTVAGLSDARRQCTALQRRANIMKVSLLPPHRNDGCVPCKSSYSSNRTGHATTQGTEEDWTEVYVAEEAIHQGRHRTSETYGCGIIRGVPIVLPLIKKFLELHRALPANEVKSYAELAHKWDTLH